MLNDANHAMYLLFSRSQSEAYGLPRGLFVIIVHRLATPPNSIPPTVSYLQVLPAIPVMVTLHPRKVSQPQILAGGGLAASSVPIVG